ncbi:MAG: ABC-2 family transporter protein [Acidimicrobiia bacterium]|nr:ABC-2 family transporter protein [Acidimicrobiia bacterium]
MSVKAMRDYYVAAARIGFQRDIQYRGATFINVLGFLIEPAIYLVVWRTVAIEQGGSVAGYSVNDFTAYYIVWTLVRVMNLAFAPNAWEWRIRGGRLNEMLSIPIQPFHRDFAYFIGSKFVWILMWIPVAVMLTLTFQPRLDPEPAHVIGFLIAIWTGFAVRFLLLYLMGMITFWTTRGQAIFDLIVAGELLLSGRLVPLALMPDWVQSVSNWLPFQWSFQFPIEVAIGRLTGGEILQGFAIQALWIAGMAFAFTWVWPRAVKNYTAVGG